MPGLCLLCASGAALCNRVRSQPQGDAPTGTSLSSAGQLSAGEWDLEWRKALSSPNSDSGALERSGKGAAKRGLHVGTSQKTVAACASVIALRSCNFFLQWCLWVHLFSLTSGSPAGPSPHSPSYRTATKAHNPRHPYSGSLYLPVLGVPPDTSEGGLLGLSFPLMA